MSDTISVRNLVLFGRHGVYPEERALGQRFHLDLTVETDLRKAGETDEPRNIINYVRLIEEAEDVFAAREYHLIEAIAENIASRILDVFEVVNAVSVTVRKPHAAIDAQFDNVEISIRRTRS